MNIGGPELMAAGAVVLVLGLVFYRRVFRALGRLWGRTSQAYHEGRDGQ